MLVGVPFLSAAWASAGKGLTFTGGALAVAATFPNARAPRDSTLYRRHGVETSGAESTQAVPLRRVSTSAEAMVDHRSPGKGTADSRALRDYGWFRVTCAETASQCPSRRAQTSVYLPPPGVPSAAT